MIDPSSSEEDSEDEHKKQPGKLPGKKINVVIIKRKISSIWPKWTNDQFHSPNRPTIYQFYY